jgi:hypothetical protein
MKSEVKQALDVILNFTANCQEGARHIVVLDRGWIFAGDLVVEDGIYTLSNAANIRTWKTGGFGALSQGAKKAGAQLDDCAAIKFSGKAMIFAVPISKDWENE